MARRIVARHARGAVEDLKANSEYTGYAESSAVIQWFWRAAMSFSQARARGAVSACSVCLCLCPRACVHYVRARGSYGAVGSVQEDKARLVQFITGTSKVARRVPDVSGAPSTRRHSALCMWSAVGAPGRLQGAAWHERPAEVQHSQGVLRPRSAPLGAHMVPAVSSRARICRTARCC